MKTAILSAAERLDRACAPFVPGKDSGESRLVILLVHSLYDRSSDPDEAGVYPHERMTTDKLRMCLEHFLELGYTFVSPDDVLGNGGFSSKAVMLTFDDGYHNNVKALPLLREFAIPATFFVCPGNVAESRSFWWDSIYRNARRCGESVPSTGRLIHRTKRLPYDEIESFITGRWGKRAFKTQSDLDRPLTLDELRDVAREPFVHLGNHTLNHTALAFQAESCVTSEIVEAEEVFRQELGMTPLAISYPNGDYNDFVISECRRLGYRLGMTIDAHWNAVHEYADEESRLGDAFRLGRYTLSGERDIRRQVESIDRKHSISAAIHRLSNHNHG